MVNHGRTLLLNRTREQLDCSWAEYTPAEFRPLEPLPAFLRAPWEALFGVDPDSWMLNWRAAQYMMLLHSSEFSQYLSALDGRIIYRTPPRIDALELPVTYTTAGQSNAAGHTLQTQGLPVDDAHNGRLSHLFLVRGTADGYVDIEEPYRSRLVNTAIADGPVALGAGGVLAAISAADVGDTWSVETLATPSRSLVQVFTALQGLTAPVLGQLFGGDGQEPYATFHRLWRDGRGFALQMTGLLLAWIYRADQVRNG